MGSLQHPCACWCTDTDAIGQEKGEFNICVQRSNFTGSYDQENRPENLTFLPQLPCPTRWGGWVLMWAVTLTPTWEDPWNRLWGIIRNIILMEDILKHVRWSSIFSPIETISEDAVLTQQAGYFFSHIMTDVVWESLSVKSLKQNHRDFFFL